MMLLKKLRRFYLLALGSLALLLLLSQGMVQLLIHRHSNDAEIINIAGRQRMLSQRLVKATHAYWHSALPEDKLFWRKQAMETLRSWTESHQRLTPAKAELYVASQEIIQLFQELDFSYRSMLLASERLLYQDHKEIKISQDIETLFAYEAQFLNIMNRIVYQFESEAQAHNKTLQRAEIILLIFSLLILALEGFFIFRPVLRELEQNIQSRMEQEEKLRLKNLAMQKAQQEAVEANRAKSFFLANMSHEIRTPLNGIIGMTEILMGSAMTDEQQEQMKIVQQSGDNLLGIINDILDFSKIESRKLELEFESFSLADCLEEVVGILGYKANAKNLELIYFIEPGIPPFIYGDAMRLKQILINLINNALKFTDEGEVLLLIEPSKTRAEDIELHFQVKDTGIGIPPDKLSRLFKAFQQVDASTTRKYGGTGLGLAICQSLVELMGGKIWVESEVSIGSTFHFIIPTKASSGLGIPENSLDKEKLLKDRRILIVDDNETNRFVQQKQVATYGMQSISVESAKEALLTLRRDQGFDLILLDYHMPGVDGLMLAREIKKQHDIPLIMMSSSGKPVVPKWEIVLDICLTKPVRRSQLVNAMLRVLNLKGLGESPSLVTSVNERMADRLPLTILVAEDNPINQKVVSKMFNGMGYQIEMVGDGYKAWQRCKTKAFDLVFMDIQMPVMSGLEATQKIRKETLIKQPIIIAMTANAMKQDREASLEAGMNDHLGKPIKLIALKKMIEIWGTKTLAEA